MSKPMIRNICAALFAVMFLFSFQTVAYATHDRYDDDDDSITLYAVTGNLCLNPLSARHFL